LVASRGFFVFTVDGINPGWLVSQTKGTMPLAIRADALLSSRALSYSGLLFLIANTQHVAIITLGDLLKDAFLCQSVEPVPQCALV